MKLGMLVVQDLGAPINSKGPSQDGTLYSEEQSRQ